ncbi:MAG: hypothetical protein ACT4PY_00475 [Armatimonadota bacterium]
MALKRIPYQKTSRLIKACLSTEEDEETVDLIRRLRPARARGYLTRGELEAVCFWKSARAIHYIRSNSRSRIRTATRRALATTSERRRLEELTVLRGVSVPMASSILMLVDPRRYGVIDIRVWQLLYAIGAVTKKPAGVGFSFDNWMQFLRILRYFARRFNVKARDIERALFCVHRKYQKGRLYASGKLRTV